MGKSYKKTPYLGICSSSGQKKFRTQEHQAERSKVKTCLQKLALNDSIVQDMIPHPKEYGNEWASPRDGKMWHGHLKYDPKWKEEFKKWMRK